MLLSSLQMIQEPNFIAVTVTFLLLLTVLRYWTFFAFLKSSMIVSQKGLPSLALPLNKEKEPFPILFDAMINWLSLLKRQHTFTDEDASISWSNETSIDFY